jgi:hypothetical protein
VQRSIGRTGPRSSARSALARRAPTADPVRRRVIPERIPDVAARDEERSMHATLHTAPTVERPAFVWIGIIIELITGIGAVPIGWQLIQDPTGGSIQLPQGWIEATPFGSYLIPGLYLMLVNGFGMLALAVLSARRHPLFVALFWLRRTNQLVLW